MSPMVQTNAVAPARRSGRGGAPVAEAGGLTGRLMALSDLAAAHRVGAIKGSAGSRLIADSALAVGLAGVTVLIDVLGPDLWSTGALFDLALAAPLVLRRRYPAVVMTVVGLLCLLQWLAGVRASGDLAFLVALYTLGSRGRAWWHLPAAVACAQLGVALVLLRWPGHAWLIDAVMLTGTITAAWVAGLYSRTRRAYLTSVVDRAETAERERDSRAQVAVAGERARIAREMHDVIAHSLSVMITLNDAAAAVGGSAQVRETVQTAAEVGRQALGEMQLVLGVLREDEGPVDLSPQPSSSDLDNLVTTVRRTGLPVQLSILGDLAAAPPSVQVTLYRIVQESLTNVLKHARNVSQVNVKIQQLGRRFTVTVENDGDHVPPLHQGSVGHGLVGMKERTDLFGGRIKAGPDTRGGWSLRATLLQPAVHR